VPVWKKGLGLQRIDQVRICHERSWAKKRLASLKTAYRRAPYFQEHQTFIEETFSKKFDRILDLNMAVIHHLMKALGIRTKLSLLSDLGITTTGNVRLVEICRRLGASQFLAQSAAKKYLEETLFHDAGIELKYFNPPTPAYPQLWGNYLGNLSAFDLVFNLGPKSHDILIGA
jgi:hypothetical protein